MNAKEQMHQAIKELLTLSCIREAEEVSSCYHISKLINEQTEGAIHITAGCIIPYLYRMLQKGEIRETSKAINGRKHIYYTITPVGEERLDKLIDAYMETHQAFLVFLKHQKSINKKFMQISDDS